MPLRDAFIELVFYGVCSQKMPALEFRLDDMVEAEYKVRPLLEKVDPGLNFDKPPGFKF